MRPIKLHLIALALASAAAATGGPVRAQPPAAPLPAASQTEADALVRLLFPAEMVDIEVKVARRAFFAGIEADARARSMLAAYPGIGEAMWEAIAPELRADFLTRLPPFWTQLTAMYGQRLTLGELQGLRRFFASATGGKVLRTMHAQIDPDPIIKDVLARGDGTFGAEASAQVARKAEARTAASLQASITAEDAAAYSQLSHAISQAKADAVSAEAQKMALAWANAPNPERDARVGKIAEEAATRYIASHKRVE